MPAGLAEGLTSDPVAIERALNEAPGPPRSRGEFVPQDAGERRELLLIERNKAGAGVERRKLLLDHLGARLLDREFREQRPVPAGG